MVIMPSFFPNLKHISINVDGYILFVISFIFVSIILTSLFIFRMDRISQLNVAQQIERMQNMADADPRKFTLTRKLLGQYNNNLLRSKKHKIPYNAFPPFSFQGPVEIHLPGYRQRQLARLINRDMSLIRRQDFIIHSEIGWIKWTRSGKFITVDCALIYLVARAEMHDNLPPV